MHSVESLFSLYLRTGSLADLDYIYCRLPSVDICRSICSHLLLREEIRTGDMEEDRYFLGGCVNFWVRPVYHCPSSPFGFSIHFPPPSTTRSLSGYPVDLIHTPHMMDTALQPSGGWQSEFSTSLKLRGFEISNSVYGSNTCE